MTLYSYHASQEQWSPDELLSLVECAESAGFDAAFSSDHLQPWAPQQGQSGFTWAWLGAALQATTRLRFATITVPGGWRYHPVLLAQAVGTLGRMFPGRLPWIALGSGQALNERPFGDWPDKDERDRRLHDGALALRALLDGQQLSADRPVATRDARIWTRPVDRPALVGAARSVRTAQWVGRWTEGLLTIAPGVDALRERIDAFRLAGGAGKPVHVKVDLCWAPSDDEALEQAHRHWRFNVGVSPDDATDLAQPEDFDAATRGTTPAQVAERVLVGSDTERFVDHLCAVAALGVDSIDLHQVGGGQRRFIERFGRDVLPALRDASRARRPTP